MLHIILDIVTLGLAVVHAGALVLLVAGNRKSHKRGDGVIAENNEAREHIKKSLAKLHEKMDQEIIHIPMLERAMQNITDAEAEGE